MHGDRAQTAARARGARGGRPARGSSWGSVLLLALLGLACEEAVLGLDGGAVPDGGSADCERIDPYSLVVTPVDGALENVQEGLASFVELDPGRLLLTFEDGAAFQVEVQRVPIPLGTRVYVRLELQDCRCVTGGQDLRFALWSVGDDGTPGPISFVTWDGADFMTGDFGSFDYQHVPSETSPRREACGTIGGELDVRVTRGSEEVATVPPGCSILVDGLRITNRQATAYDAFPGLCNDERQRFFSGMIVNTQTLF